MIPFRRNLYRPKVLAASWAIIAVFVAQPAGADITYTMSVLSTPLTSPVSDRFNVTVALAGQLKRVEVTADSNGSTRRVVQITRPDLGEIMTIDPQLKIYKVEPIQTLLQMMAFPLLPDLSSTSGSDSFSNATSIAGEEEGWSSIDGYPADHLVLKVHCTDPAGIGLGTDNSVEYWASKIKTGYRISSDGAIKRPDGSTYAYSTKGNDSLISELTQQMPVSISVRTPVRLIDMVLVRYALTPVPGSTFEPPAQFTVLDSDQFVQSETRSASSGQVHVVPALPGN